MQDLLSPVTEQALWKITDGLCCRAEGLGFSPPSVCWSKKQVGSLTIGKLRQARNSQKGGGRAGRSDSSFAGGG